MYQPQSSTRDKLATLALVVLVHVGLAFALVNLSGPVRDALPQDVVEIFDVTEPPPPPPEPKVMQEPQPEKAKPKEKEGAASEKNLKSKATPVKDPEPRIPLPVPQPMPVSKTPNTGSDSTQGASNVAGPGTGAGGKGTGTGSGGSGTGTGGGGVAQQPSRISGGISRRDYPRGVRPVSRNERVFVSFYIDTDGYVRECRVDISSGNVVLDRVTCDLIRSRFRYRPARDTSGRPVRFERKYIQDWSTGGPPPPLPPGTTVTEPTQPG